MFQSILNTFITCNIKRNLFNSLVFKIGNGFNLPRTGVYFALLTCKFFTPKIISFSRCKVCHLVTHREYPIPPVEQPVTRTTTQVIGSRTNKLNDVKVGTGDRVVMSSGTWIETEFPYIASGLHLRPLCY